MEHYDFIIGFGNACSCSQILRAAGLQHLSFPFDWVIYEDDHDLRLRADTVVDDFSGWLERLDLTFRGNVDWYDKDIYFNTKTRCLFNHEFPKGIDIAVTMPEVKAKYDRRVRRMYACIRAASRVLILRVDRPNQAVPTPDGDCGYLLERLSEKFPGVRFDLLHLTHQSGLRLADMTVARPLPNVTRLTFDYKDPDPSSASYAPDIPLVAGFLAERYSVVDYRTPEEIRAKDRRDCQAKCRAGGVKNAFRHLLAEGRDWLARTFRSATDGGPM